MKPDGLTKDQNEILDLRDRVFELEEEVRQLRSMLKPLCDERLPLQWHLTPAEERLLLVLARAPEGYMSLEALRRAITVDPHAGPNGVRVRVSRLRKTLGVHGVKIYTRWGGGYYLPPDSRELVRRSTVPESVPITEMDCRGLFSERATA